MKLNAAQFVVYAQELDKACEYYEQRIECALELLKGLDGTSFTFPEPRNIINNAKKELEKALAYKPFHG